MNSKNDDTAAAASTSTPEIFLLNMNISLKGSYDIMRRAQTILVYLPC